MKSSNVVRHITRIHMHTANVRSIASSVVAYFRYKLNNWIQQSKDNHQEIYLSTVTNLN